MKTHDSKLQIVDRKLQNVDSRLRIEPSRTRFGSCRYLLSHSLCYVEELHSRTAHSEFTLTRSLLAANVMQVRSAAVNLDSMKDEIQKAKGMARVPEPFFRGSKVEARRWSREYRNLLIAEEITRLPQCDVWQISGAGAKVFVTLEGIRVCHASELLKTLI